MLGAALALAKRGIPVFPCWQNKKPATGHGFKDATTDQATITRWFAGTSDYLIGVPTGKASGLCVLDIDVTDLSILDKLPGKLPQTRIHGTQRGRHYVFKHRPGIKNGTNIHGIKGVDQRGEGGYGIHWPAHGMAIVDDTEPHEAPDWMINGTVKATVTPLPVSPSAKSATPLTWPAVRKQIVQDLDKLNPDTDYESWVRIGMAIYHESGGSDDGYDLFHGWSQRGSKYVPVEWPQKWHKLARPTEDRLTWRSIRSAHKDVIGAPAGTEDGEYAYPKLIERINSWRPKPLDALTRVQDPAFYVDKLILKQVAGALVSPGGLGKTTILVDLGIATAIGGKWLGLDVLEGCFALLSLDDAQDDLDALLAHMLAKRELTPAELEKVRHRVRLISLREVAENLSFAVDGPQGIRATEVVTSIVVGLGELWKAVNQDTPLRCVALDTMRQFAGGTANDDRIATVFTQELTRIADHYQCAAIVSHHMTKAGARSGDADQYSGSGSGALADNLRFVLTLQAIEAKAVQAEMTLTGASGLKLMLDEVFIKIVDTRGSVLRKAIAPIYVARKGYTLTRLTGQLKTVEELARDAAFRVLKVVNAGAVTSNAIYEQMGGRKAACLNQINEAAQLAWIERVSSGPKASWRLTAQGVRTLRDRGLDVVPGKSGSEEMVPA